MSVTTTNLIQGPATLYAAIFGSTEPATIATTPATPFRDLGGTQDGVMLSVELTFSELNVDQVLEIPESRLTKRVAKIKTNLAEATLANWALALNELASSVATNVFTPSAGDTTSAKVPYAALILDGVAPGGFRRRVTVRKALQIGNAESGYKKDSQTLIPVEFAAHWVSPSVRSFLIEDAIA